MDNVIFVPFSQVPSNPSPDFEDRKVLILTCQRQNRFKLTRQ